MMENTLPQPGLRERRFAALAHASILSYLLGMATGPFMLCFIFPIIPLIIGVTFRKKDKWVAFHAWQALLYQSVLCCVFLFIGLPIFFTVFARCAPGFGQNSSACGAAFFPLSLLGILFILLIPLGMIGLGVVRGIRILGENDIDYPVISSLLRRRLKIARP